MFNKVPTEITEIRINYLVEFNIDLDNRLITYNQHYFGVVGDSKNMFAVKLKLIVFSANYQLTPGLNFGTNAFKKAL